MDNKKLKEINEYMIGRGVPVEKDNVGYNKADYNKMYLIGMLNTDYNDFERYTVLKTLQKYRNTQLTEYKEELEEDVRKMNQQLNAIYNNNEIDDEIFKAQKGLNHSTKDYGKEDLIIKDITDKSVVCGFKEFINGVNVYKYNGNWTKISGKSYLNIPFETFNSFLEDCKDFGRFGYELSKTDKELIEKAIKTANNKIIKTTDNETAKTVAEPITITDMHEKNAYNKDLFKINTNNKELVNKLWGLKGKGLIYVDNKTSLTEIIISTEPYMYKELYNFCKDEGIVCNDLEKAIEDMTYNNESNNKLVDLSTLSLPFKPYDFQIEDASKIVSKKRALIGHEMGAGKTFISILVGESINEPKLVIVPESLRLNWKKEILNVNPNADVSVVYSKDKNVRFGDWTIMGYQTASKFKEEILKKDIQCVFVDESHNCKAVDNSGNPKSKRAESVIEITNNAKYCYLLTGTPIPTRNKDLYNILKMLKSDALIKYNSFFKYGVRFCDGYNNGFGWSFEGNTNAEELHEILSDLMVRRLKKDVLSHLKKQRQFIPLEHNNKEYKKIEEQFYLQDDLNTYMGLAMSGRRILSKDKIAPSIELAETIVNGEDSVVLVTEFNETLDKIMEHFGEDACYIRGGMSDIDKQKAIDDFQAGKKKVCVLNTIAGGVGITLTKAHNMIILDYDWTPSNMTQVEDRICRSGQTELCNIYYMYCDNAIIDKVFVDMITSKSDNIDKVVDNVDNTFNLTKDKNTNSTYLDNLKTEIANRKGDIPKKRKTKKVKIEKEKK